MVDITHILGGPWSPPEAPKFDPPELQLRDSMERAGLRPPREILLDGKLHRFASGTKGSPGHGDKPGWYIAFGDGIPAGRFGDWRSGIEVTWRADVGREMTLADEMAHARRLAEAKMLRDAELARKHEVTANTVESIWSGCSPAYPAHPYLRRKGIDTHGARVTGDGRLVVPLFDEDGALSTLQYIDAEGGKLYHAGGQTGGMFWMLGTMDEPGVLYMAEGFATAATIHEATGRPCAVAYSASNLVPVCGTLRTLYGVNQSIVIVADNDKSGVGQKYAEQASAKFGARVVMPAEPGDANDFAQGGGDLLGLLVPQTSGWLVRADEFCQQPAPISWIVKYWLQEQALIMVHGPSGGGKAQPLDELVLTPEGWCEMGEIKVGDYVIGSAGFPVLVTGVYPQGIKPEWEVSFSNGAKVRCCDEHLWDVGKAGSRRQILTTAEIAKKPHHSWWSVPLCRPINYRSNQNPLPLDPYLLGAIIGDGGITKYVGFSSADDEIINEVKRSLPAGHEIRSKGNGCDYQITSQRGQPNYVWSALRLLGLAGKKSDQKFIPDEYMTASPMDRLSVLQGLMDTDGYVSASNGTTADFSNSSRVLVEQVASLVSSLGGISNPIRTKETSGLPCHTVTFRMGKGVNPFRLSRKAKRCAFGGQNLNIRVLDAKPTGRMVPMQCISVASDDSLYVTNGYILTHNTFVVLDWCLRVAAGVPEWAGSRVKPGTVVYLAGEGHHGLRGRVAAWKHHQRSGPLSMWLSKDGCDLNTPTGYQKVLESVGALERRPDLIVVDTLHRFLLGDENSAQDAKTMLDACGALMGHFGCSVILVHHTGVSDEAQHRARGSSAWRGALDIEISIVPGKDGAPLEIVQRKSKDAEMAQPIFAELTPVQIPGWYDEDGEPVGSAVVEVVAAPTPAKKDSKLDSLRKQFEAAWWASGAEDRDGLPYLTRAGLRSKLIEDGCSEATADKKMKPGSADQLVGALIVAGIIKPDDNGWVVCSSVHAAALMIAKCG